MISNFTKSGFIENETDSKESSPYNTEDEKCSRAAITLIS